MKTSILLAGCAALLLGAAPASALITGSSTASNCGEGGNWIDLAFTTDEGVTLVDAWWDWNATGVWLDADGTSLCPPQNQGVTDVDFYFDVPVGTDTQDFGLTATGFDGGDYYRFKMDLDMGPGGSGSPFTTDYYGGTVTVEFSDGTILTATFDEPYDEPNGATAAFSNLAALPDLAFTTKPGWAAPMVPRPAADAVWTSVPEPATLIGEADATWINAVCENVGGSPAGATRMNFHLDGEFLGYRNLWTIDPGAWNGPINYGPFDVRGGRHVIRVTADAGGAVAEGDETNNVYAAQWCWQGDLLARGVTVTRAAPPLYDQDAAYATLDWHNCDGVRLVPDPSFAWCIVWAERLVTDGHIAYPMRLHPASDDPRDAFGTNVMMTRWGEGLQAMIVNTDEFGAGPWDVGIMRFGPSDPDYRIGHTTESPYPFDFGVDPETPYSGTRIMAFPFDVGAGDLGPATLVARTDPADGPVRMGWLRPGFAAGNLDSLRGEVATDAVGVAAVNLDLDVPGTWCAVVYGNRAEHPTGLAVNVGLYGPKPDLEPVTLAGWCAPVVPRAAPDAALFSCPLPDTLVGGQAATWLNVACRNRGTAAADTVSFLLRLDGTSKLGIRNFMTPLGAGLPRVATNLELGAGPWTVPGGRHTVSYELDYLDELAESVEANNLAGRQYCWSPPVLATNAPLTVDDPDRLPAREAGWAECEDGATLYWNCDGLRMPYIPPVGKNGHWFATAVMPWSAGLDIDVQLHVPLSGTQDGFGPAQLVGSSSGGDGQIDFVLVNGDAAPDRAHDVGVYEDRDASSPGYHAQEARSSWSGIPGPGGMGPYAMGPGRMLNLHDFLLDPGTWLITLTDEGAGVDWGLSLHVDGMYFAKAAALATADDGTDGVSERMLVTVPPHTSACLAVWKTDVGELAKDGAYKLWLAPGVSGVRPDVPDATVSRLAGAAPNPFNPQTVVAFDVARPGPVRVTVHDLQGRLVRVLAAGTFTAGRHEAEWDGRDEAGRRAASGVYVARLVAADAKDVMKLTLVK